MLMAEEAADIGVNQSRKQAPNPYSAPAQPALVSPVAEPAAPAVGPAPASDGQGWTAATKSKAPTAAAGATESDSTLSKIFGLWTDGGKSQGLTGAAANGLFGSKDEAAAPKVTEAEVKAADSERKNLDKQLVELALDEKQQAAIKERTQGLSGAALVQEMAALKRAMSGPNADRALATYSDLSKLAATDPKAKERLTPEVMAMMVSGVGDRRTDSDRGQSGILGGRQARDSAQGLLSMNDSDYKKTVELLHQAGTDKDGKEIPGADPHAEQALILKAIAARKQQFKAVDEGAVDKVLGVLGLHDSPAAKAAKDIEGFAKDIRGTKRDELIRTTAVIDIDGAKDDDGLKQRYSHTCVPTTAQMVKGEADPIYARKLNREGLGNLDTESETAKEQRKELEAGNGQAVSRQGAEDRAKVREGMVKLKEEGRLTPQQQANLARYLRGWAPEKEDTVEDRNKAIAELRKVQGGHPTDAELARIRDDGDKVGTGMDEQKGLNNIASSTTDINYQRTATKGNLESQQKEIDAALKDGQSVPFSISGGSLANIKAAKDDPDGTKKVLIRDPGTGKEEWFTQDEVLQGSGHAMLLSDVRTDKDGKKRYLMSDPMSGATRWVSEADLKSGAFAKPGGAFPDLGVVDTRVDDVYLDGAAGK